MHPRLRVCHAAPPRVHVPGYHAAALAVPGNWFITCRATGVPQARSTCTLPSIWPGVATNLCKSVRFASLPTSEISEPDVEHLGSAFDVKWLHGDVLGYRRRCGGGSAGGIAPVTGKKFNFGN